MKAARGSEEEGLQHITALADDHDDDDDDVDNDNDDDNDDRGRTGPGNKSKLEGSLVMCLVETKPGGWVQSNADSDLNLL